MNGLKTMRKVIYTIVNILFIVVFAIQIYVIMEEYQNPHEISTSQHHEKFEVCFCVPFNI